MKQNSKDPCVDKEWHHLCLQEEVLAQKVQWFLVFYLKRVKGFKKRDMVQNLFEKIPVGEQRTWLEGLLVMAG